MQTLAEALVIGEQKGAVLMNRAAERAPELVPLKAGGRTGVEIIARVEGVVAQEIEQRPVPLVGPRLGYDQHLPRRPFAIVGAVGIRQHVEFAHRIYAQQLLTGAAGLHVVLGRAGEFHAV